MWGPFSIVWGLAIAIATAFLYKDREKPDRHIFIVGTFLGGAYEYVCSVLQRLYLAKYFGITVRFHLIWEAVSICCIAFSGDCCGDVDKNTISEVCRMD